MSKPTFEVMTFRKRDGSFAFNVTIATGLGPGESWTSREVPLKARDLHSAQVEAKHQAALLAHILTDGLKTEDSAA